MGARTVSDLKADPVLPFKPSTVDRYVSDLESEGLIEVTRSTTQSNEIALTRVGAAGQECLDPAARLIHPAQRDLSIHLTRFDTFSQVRCSAPAGSGGGQEAPPDRTAGAAAAPHTLWGHLADTGTPDADSGAGFIQWLGDEGRETSAYALQKTLRAGRRVEGVTCVDAPVEEFADDRTVYLSALESELHVVT